MKRTGRNAPLSDLLVAEVLQRWPKLATAFRKVGLGNCIGCAMAPFETVEEAIHIFKLDPKKVLPELERATKGESK